MASIVIVEDDMNLADMYKKKIEEGGHSAYISQDLEAVNKIRETKPNLVLLDVMMPSVNGLDILRELKNDTDLMSIPVVLLTNAAGDDVISKGLQYGAYGYLLKSETTPDMILSRINMTLEETGQKKD